MFRPSERSDGGAFRFAGGGQYARAQLSKPVRGCPAQCDREIVAFQNAVSLADQSVQVRQRRNLVRRRVAIRSNHFEPQPQFRQVHRVRADVDAEEIGRNHVSCSCRGILPAADSEGHEQAEGAQQERAASSGRVEYGHLPDCLENSRGELRQLGTRFVDSAAELTGQPRFERGADQLVDQRARCVERPCGPARFRIHHAFENPAEHVGTDGGAGAGLRPDGEVIPFEELFEGIDPETVRKLRLPAPFQRMRFEEPAVEERNPAEFPRRSGAAIDRPVEGPEEQGAEQAPRDPAAALQHPVQFLGQESRPAVEPAALLNEIEEEDPGQVEQRQRVPVAPRNSPGQLGHGRRKGGAELPEEALVEGSSCQGVGPTEASRQGQAVAVTRAALEDPDVDRAEPRRGHHGHRRICDARCERQAPPQRVEPDHQRQESAPRRAPGQAVSGSFGVPGLRSHQLQAALTAHQREPGYRRVVYSQAGRFDFVPGRVESQFQRQAGQVFQSGNRFQRVDERHMVLVGSGRLHTRTGELE